MNLLDLIKTALKKAGLKEDLAEDLEKKIKTEDEIEAVVNELKEKQKKEDLTEADLDKIVKEAGLEELYEKVLKAKVDRVLQKAIQTHDEKLKAKAEEERKQAEAEEEKKKAEEKMTDEQKEISELKETVKGLNERIGQFLDKTSKDGLYSKFKTALKEVGIDEKLADKINIEKEDEIEATVGELKTMIDAREQEVVNKKLEELGIPKGGNGGTKTPTEEAVADFAERQEKGEVSGEFQGKSLKDLGIEKT